MMHGKMKIFCNFLIYLLNKPYSLQDHVSAGLSQLKKQKKKTFTVYT